MTGEMRVDVAGVRALASDLTTAADRAAGADPVTPIAAAASAVPGSDAAAALARWSPVAGYAVSGTARRLREMSDAASVSAAGYARTDQATATRLAGI